MLLAFLATNLVALLSFYVGKYKHLKDGRLGADSTIFERVLVALIL